MEEIWKAVVGYEGLYEVSSLGNVRSLYDWWYCHNLYRIKLLKPEKTNKWYLRVALYKWEVKARDWIHRIVAQAFHWNPNNYPVVMHLDNNPLNNNADNLKWWTYKENIQQCYKEWRSNNHLQLSHPRSMLWKFGKEHHLSKAVNQYSLELEFIKNYWWISEAKRETWISDSRISECCRGKRVIAWWFIWRYV